MNILNSSTMQFTSSIVDGVWSSWTEGSCSKTCGVGIRINTRICNNPSRTCGGLLCEGTSTRKVPCNESCCPGKIIIVTLYMYLHCKSMNPFKFKALSDALFA